MLITDVLPQPVTVTLGDRAHRVPRLRLRQVAGLQQWLADACPAPIDEADLAAAATAWDRKVAAARAYLRCERFPIRVTGRLAPRLFASGAGLRTLLAVLGVDADPSSVTTGQYWALWDAIWGGGDVLDRLRAILDGPAPADAEPDRPDPDVDWATRFCAVARETGWTFDQIGDLYVSQWLAFCRGGEDRDVMVVHPGEDAEAKRAERLRIFEEAGRRMKEAMNG